jgi:hypothetical protein
VRWLKSADDQLAIHNDIRQNDKRYEERFARLEADIREIKVDLRQVFKPVLPH